MIEMKEQREKPFAFFMDKIRLEVIFLPIFEYKKNVHALLGEGGGEYVDRVL
ncbi:MULTISPECIES: amino acid ABC transporter ATP-binding protein [Bacillus]|uniref:Amino acid ABC transporter ATP-binding protein n=1 Tax=Bacillus wiedmannii TaxID=1890302 RepID=A0ABX5DMY8_9BACI|nr:amino acid ABC transporter ATP-binding protein [Bacillus wiedmannii]PRT03077.1 amino acid ABC transporter ATP-binding protein [Bacillus wiedmannii]PRT37580.1 amino acid ABC transporter ATP-binding protein [Bacillus wiedmannii]